LSPPGAAEFVICDHTIETHFTHLKTTMGLDVVKCQTMNGVLKELIVFALIYNLCVWACEKRRGVSTWLSNGSASSMPPAGSQRHETEPTLPALVVNPK
jgi:hypothetical protein